MANDNKNTNELVTSDDATAELQELTLQQVLAKSAGEPDTELEDDADTFEIERLPGRRPSSKVRILSADLEAREATVSRLQYDVERLRSRLAGLQSEVRAREDIGDDLNRRINELEGELATNASEIRQRDKTIRDLKADIRSRAEALREAESGHEEVRSERDRLEGELGRLREDHDALLRKNNRQTRDPARAEGQISAAEASNTELAAQLQRTEAYADEIRRHLHDKSAEVEFLERTLQHTRLELQETTALVENLETRLRTQGGDNRALADQVSVMQQRHNEEMKRLRGDLDDAEAALARNLLINEQLAADLEESRSYRERMEQMLNRSDDDYRDRITGLETEVESLKAANAKLTEELSSRNDALNALLAEVQRHGEQSDDVELPSTAGGTPKERVNRMLVGRIDNQELRFPLFKKRLTIGRTQQNDIQLNVPYISRRHAVIITEGNATRVVDWGSRNGVFVNSRRVTEHFLKTGDRITIGNADFRYEERPRRDA